MTENQRSQRPRSGSWEGKLFHARGRAARALHDFFFFENLRNPARSRRAGLMRQFRSCQLDSIDTKFSSTTGLFLADGHKHSTTTISPYINTCHRPSSVPDSKLRFLTDVGLDKSRKHKVKNTRVFLMTVEVRVQK